MKLSIDGAICRIGKISNNTLKLGDGKFESEFTIPFEGIVLMRDQLNDALEDTRAFDSWYETSVGKPAKPCAWWLHSKGEFPIPDDHEGKWLHIQFTGGQVIEFSETDGKSEKDKKTPGFRISKIVFVPNFGGLTEFKGSFHVRPGLGRENLLLQEHQHREVKIWFGQTKPVEKDSRQESLPLEPPKPAESNVVYANAFAEFHRRRAESLQLAKEAAQGSVPEDDTLTAPQPAQQAADASVSPEPEAESEAINKSVTNDTGPASEAPRDAGSGDYMDDSKREDMIAKAMGYASAADAASMPSHQALQEHVQMSEQTINAIRSDAEERRRQRAMARASVTAATPEEFQKKVEEDLAKFNQRPDGVIDGTK